MHFWRGTLSGTCGCVDRFFKHQHVSKAFISCFLLFFRSFKAFGGAFLSVMHNILLACGGSVAFRTVNRCYPVQWNIDISNLPCHAYLLIDWSIGIRVH
jgi:hypothetical protein